MGTYAASDGLLNVAAIGSWTAFCTALGAPELASDPRFHTHHDRLRHRSELRQLLADVLSGSTVADWVRRLNDAGFPAGPVLRVDEALADPQVRHLEMVSAAGEGQVLRHPVTFTGTPASVRSPAPTAGGHTREVLAELGYAEDRITDLIATGVVATDRSAPAWNS